MLPRKRPGWLVAGLTKMGLTLYQNPRVYGPMCIVAKCAALANRVVLPKEGAPFLGMAIRAGFIDGEALQLGRSRTAMGLVAIPAGNDLFPYRVGIGLEKLGTHNLVAFITDACLTGSIQHPILPVQGVTT